MRFSIVTPILNGMPWLPECVDSVATQRSHVEVEHLVFDAGSTDGSREWLRDHIELGYSAVFEPDAGQTDALIKGFSRATGDVFGWLNADDVLEPGALARVAEILEAKADVALVSGCCLKVAEDGAYRGLIGTPRVHDFHGLVSHLENPAQPATFFRADAYRAAGGLDRRYDLAMDVDLWLRLSQMGALHFLPKDILARFRVHEGSKSVKWEARAAQEDLAIRRRHGLTLRNETALRLLYTARVGLPVRSVRRRTLRLLRPLFSR
jgi:GT2 family glycosyltransferase